MPPAFFLFVLSGKQSSKISEGIAGGLQARSCISLSALSKSPQRLAAVCALSMSSQERKVKKGGRADVSEQCGGPCQEGSQEGIELFVPLASLTKHNFSCEGLIDGLK